MSTSCSSSQESQLLPPASRSPMCCSPGQGQSVQQGSTVVHRLELMTPGGLLQRTLKEVPAPGCWHLAPAGHLNWSWVGGASSPFRLVLAHFKPWRVPSPGALRSCSQCPGLGPRGPLPGQVQVREGQGIHLIWSPSLCCKHKERKNLSVHLLAPYYYY